MNQVWPGFFWNTCKFTLKHNLNYVFSFSAINQSQCRRFFSSTEKAESTTESSQPTTELEKKLLVDVESLTNDKKTLEEKNNELLVSFNYNNHSIVTFDQFD